MRLFRAIGHDEYIDLQNTGKWRQGLNSMEGKWFAESFDDACEWGYLLGHHASFWVVEIVLPQGEVERLFRIATLDGIGPARYAEIEDLKFANFVSFQKISGK